MTARIVHLLGANQSYDTGKQVVEKNQIIQMNGFGDDEFVVYEIDNTNNEVVYKLINLRTKEFRQTDVIRPLSQKFGTGYYFDENNLRFLTGFQVGLLQSTADLLAKKVRNEKEEEEENIRVKEKTKVQPTSAATTLTGSFLIVDYSPKALAIFGDTRPIKEQLKALGGRFNPRLTHNEKKQAGWIFQKTKEVEIRNLLNIQ